MKPPLWPLRALAALALGLLVAGCAPAPSRQSAGEFVDDAVITTKVKAALIEDELTKARDITVKTYKGRVQLSGFVDSRAEASRAVQIARRTEGVQSVANDMRLK